MSAIGASMGFFFTSESAYEKLRTDNDGNVLLKTMTITGKVFSVILMILQLIPIPGLASVHFGKESYLMLIIRIVIRAVAFSVKNKAKS